MTIILWIVSNKRTSSFWKWVYCITGLDIAWFSLLICRCVSFTFIIYPSLHKDIRGPCLLCTHAFLLLPSQLFNSNQICHQLRGCWQWLNNNLVQRNYINNLSVHGPQTEYKLWILDPSLQWESCGSRFNEIQIQDITRYFFMKKLTVLVNVRNGPRNVEKRRVFLMISMETRESQVTFQNNAACSEENSRIIYMQLLCVAFLQNQTKVHSFVYLTILSMVRNGV